MGNKQNISVVVAAVALVVIAGISFWYWSKNRQTLSAPSSQTKETLAPTLGGAIFEKTQNPLKDKLPEINPFESQKNPFDAIYQNPFK